MKKIKAGADNSKGFTLLELSVALAGLAIIATAAIPYFIRQAEVAAAQRTTKEVSSIQEASKWYRVQNGAWPASVATLQTAGYLNPSWSAQNPWGNAYSISSNSTSLTVTTTLPDSMGGVLSRALPGVSSSTVGTNRTVNSVIPVPGQEASLTTVTNTANTAKSTADSALSMAQGSALPVYDPWARISLPAQFDYGFYDCQWGTGASGWVMVGIRTSANYPYILELLCRDTRRH